MATDSMILTAARDLYAAEQAVKKADEAKQRADAEVTTTARLADEARKRHTLAQTRLLDLSRQKPAEPASRVDVVIPEAPRAEPQRPIPATVPVDLRPVPSIPTGPVPVLSNKGARRVSPAESRQ